MPRETVPVEIKMVSHGMEQVEEYSHPAFAQIQINRCTGSIKLHGSALDTNEEFVTLSVQRGTFQHHLGRNWHHAEGQDLVEVAMSAAQFADLITNLNRGGGVPCTLRTHDGASVPQIPWETTTEASKVVTSFLKDVTSRLGEMEKMVQRVQELMNKVPTKAEREAVVKEMNRFARLFSDSAPFMVESFQEAAEKVVTQAKAEVDAFTIRTVQQAGLETMIARFPKALPPKDGE